MNPCCCISLRKGTSILAWIDGILSFILLVLYTLLLTGGILYDPNVDAGSSSPLSSPEKIQLIISCSLYILACLTQKFLALYLGKAAKNENHRGLRNWIIISIIVLLIGAINSALHFHTTFNLCNLVSATAGIAYKTYEIIVVLSFRQELTKSKKRNKADDDSEKCDLQSSDDEPDNVNINHSSSNSPV